jgi:hypothetical protein
LSAIAVVVDGDRREPQAESENDREPDPPHGHLVGTAGGSLADDGRSQELAALVEHALLDDLVRPQEQRLRDRQSERLGGGGLN